MHRFVISVMCAAALGLAGCMLGGSENVAQGVSHSGLDEPAGAAQDTRQADGADIPLDLPELSDFTTEGKPTKTIETPWGPREVYYATKDPVTFSKDRTVDKSGHNKPQMLGECKFQTKFTFAVPAPDNVSEDFDTSFKVVELPYMRGKFLSKTSVTYDDVPSIKYDSPPLIPISINHPTDYVEAIESKLTERSKDFLCPDTNESYVINLVLIQLYIFDDAPSDLSRPYGHVEVDVENQIIEGVFIFNPHQILADQYWLTQGFLIAPEQTGFEVEEYKNWKEKYSNTAYYDREYIEDIPDHLRWLFSISASQTYVVSSESTWKSILVHSYDAYIDITKLLINESFKNNGRGSKSYLLKEIGSPKLFEKYKYTNP